MKALLAGVLIALLSLGVSAQADTLDDIKKDETRLVEEVNKWILANIKNGRLNDLNKKYFGSDLPDLIVKQ